MKKLSVIIIMFLTLILTSCSSNYKYDKEKVNIVATTTMLGDLARQVGKDKVNVHTIMGPSMDPHMYKPTIKDSIALKDCDFILASGLHLEGKMVELLDNLKNKKKVFIAGEYLKENFPEMLYLPDGGFNEEDGLYDPHIWFDVNIWSILTKGLGDELIQFNEMNKDYYEAQVNSYLLELDNLNSYIKTRSNELGGSYETDVNSKRILLTAHDAFGYFGRAYGYKVGAIQGMSTSTEASPNAINNLVKEIEKYKVKAIFIESSIPKNTINSVIAAAKSRGIDVEIGGELYSDALGSKEFSEYINAIKKNIDVIVDGLK